MMARSGVGVKVGLLVAAGLGLYTAGSAFAQQAMTGGLNAKGGAAVVYLNTDPKAEYAGSESCATAGCHDEIGKQYAATPMGHSMVPANTQTELARVPEAVTVYSATTKRYYRVYRKGDELYQSAYVLDKRGHIAYEIAHRMDYVVGGGLTGYSYLFRIGDWFFQAPLSFYTEHNTWDLSPGYNLDDIGFTRPILTACLSCHNGQPTGVAKRDGKYAAPYFRFGETAISCESCHGPGKLHVEEMEMRRGQADLSAGEIDPTIVNPAKLAPNLADDLCMDCHQSGDAIVLMPGKDFLDYRPGKPLAETMVIFRRPLKEEQRAEANRLETEPPVRGSLEVPMWWKNASLQLSKCYQATHGKLTCITCHVIHHPPAPETKMAHYRSKCLSCHTETSCAKSVEERKAMEKDDDCVACHMEKRAVAGIAHSTDTKHRIVRKPGQTLPEAAFEQPTADLPGMLWTNRPPDGLKLAPVTMLQGYWKVSTKDPTLKKYCVALLEELSKTSPNDPVVLYGKGAMAMAQKKDFEARDCYEKALKGGSEELITFFYLSTALDNLEHQEEAERVLERGVEVYPYSAEMRVRLARQYLHDGKTWRARLVVNEYMKYFPEEPSIRAVQLELQAAGM